MDRRPRPEVDLTAGCACGEVAVTIRGRVRAMLLCACAACQKATGTGHASVAIFDRAGFTVTGETKSFARPADSGAVFTRWFCPACGTPLYGNSSRWPDSVMLPAGLFGAEADWFAPSQVIFARGLRAWDAVPEGLPRHAAYREAGA